MPRADTDRLASWADTFAARYARAGGRSDAPLSAGMPRSIGSAERGAALLAGRYRMGGIVVDSPGRPPWEAAPHAAEALREAHGFGWMDDLAAVPDAAAEDLARAWAGAWIARFGEGWGPGWVADLAGRRVLRLAHHGEMLGSLPLAAAISRHAAFLASRAGTAPPGLPRVEALVGLLHAALALDPADPRADAAVTELDAAANGLIGRDGGVASRSPEGLARALLLLGWAAETAITAGRNPGHGLLGSMARAAPVLRGLVQPDGRLPRFHGGSAAPGLADAALALVGNRRTAAPGVAAMGFARVRHGRAGLVLDAAPPPAAASATAHASTLALELTVGRRPLVTNCGPGARFGPRWGGAARATDSHATLSLDGFSSARFGRDGRHLAEGPRAVRLDRDETETGTVLVASHDGYSGTHGLIHERTIELSRDGRELRGEDALLAVGARARRRFERARRSGPMGFAVRFHLHPSVEASLDMGGHAVSMLLPSGALWVFRSPTPETRLALEASVHFPTDGLEPEAARQIVLFSSAGEYATRIAWQFAAAPASRPLPRDLGE